MKMDSTIKSLLFTAVLFCTTTLFAQKELTVRVETPGTLGVQISEQVPDYLSIEKLVVSGTLNGRDIELIREMCGRNYSDEPTEGKLISLDMKEVEFEAGRSYSSAGAAMVVGEIGSYMFQRTILETIVLPKSIKKIGKYAFNVCSNLKNITLPDGLEYLDTGAFYLCSSLEGIDIPATVTDIENAVFTRSGLKSIILPEGITVIRKNTFRYCKNLETIHLPKSLINIYDNAFEDCEKMKQITLPENLGDLFSGVFKGCTSLSRVIVENLEPPGTWFSFDESTYKKAILYVPVGSYEKYVNEKIMANWYEFNTIMEGNPSSVGATQSDNIHISVMGTTVFVDNVPANQPVHVYTTNGQLIKTLISSGTTLEISLKENTLYLIQTGGLGYKVRSEK